MLSNLYNKDDKNLLDLTILCPDILSLILVKYVFINNMKTYNVNDFAHNNNIKVAKILQDIFMVGSTCRDLRDFIKKREILKQIYAWANVNLIYLDVKYGKPIKDSDIYKLLNGCADYYKVTHSLKCSVKNTRQCKFCKKKTNCLTKASLHTSVCFGRIMSCTHQKYKHKLTHSHCTVRGPKLGMILHSSSINNHEYVSTEISCITVRWFKQSGYSWNW